jgi:hypothetical protein
MPFAERGGRVKGCVGHGMVPSRAGWMPHSTACAEAARWPSCRGSSWMRDKHGRIAGTAEVPGVWVECG